jgi:hypothetical protein
MPTHATYRPGGWIEQAKAWAKSIQDKNQVLESREKEAEARLQMTQEDILSQKMRDQSRNGDTKHFTLPG